MSAGAVPESEPNDSAEEADEVQAEVEVTGSIVNSDSDLWRFRSPEPGLVTVDLSSSVSEGRVMFSGPGGAIGPGREDLGDSIVSYGFPVAGEADYFVILRWNNAPYDYSMTLHFSAGLSPLVGPDEVEPNGAGSDATPGAVDTLLSGLLPSRYRDDDWWSFEVSRQGQAVVEVVGPDDIVLWAFEDGDELVNTMRTSAAHVEFEVPRPGTVLVHLYRAQTMATNESNYTLHFRFEPDLAADWAGADETEPNNDPSSPTYLTTGATARGLADSWHDPIDTFAVEGEAGDIVSLAVSFEDEFGAGEVTDPDDEVSWGLHEGSPTTSYVTSFLFDSDSVFVFQVSAWSRSVNYTVTSSLRHLPIYDDGVATLEELNASEIGFSIKLANSGSGQRVFGYHLRNSDGYLWGVTLCVRLATTGTVHGIAVPAGLSFYPDDPSLQVLVASRTGTVDVPSGERGCFRAMAYDETGAIGHVSDEYRIGAMVSGDALDVVLYVDQTKQDGPEGVLALWAVTSGTTEARARDWTASDETIVSARNILNEVGLETRLNSAVGAEVGPALWVALVAVAAVALLGLLVYARRSRGPPSPPLAQPLPPASPLPPPGAPPAAAPFPSAPQPVGAPPESRLYATIAPPPVACPSCGAPVAPQAPTCPKCSQPLIWG